MSNIIVDDQSGRFRLFVKIFKFILDKINQWAILDPRILRGLRMAEWSELTRLTGGDAVIVERVRLKRSGLAVEGEFEPPPLALLCAEDQIFVAAFVKCHGSIKEMERIFGISYPTVKNRLNRIGGALGMIDVDMKPEPSKGDILEQLAAGEINVDDAVERLKRC